jgi:hypothetical protein
MMMSTNLSSKLHALNLQCDGVLGAWYKNEQSDGWRTMDKGRQSSAKTLIRSLENVFRKYFEYKEQLGQSNYEYFKSFFTWSGMPDIKISPSYASDCIRFFNDLDTFMKTPDSLFERLRKTNPKIKTNRFNAICPVMNINMRKGNPSSNGDEHENDFVIEEIGLRPCAFRFSFLTHLFRVIVDNIAASEASKGRLIIQSLGVRAELVQVLLEDIGIKIDQIGKWYTMRNKWIVDCERILELKGKLSSLDKYEGNSGFPVEEIINSDTLDIERHNTLIERLVNRSSGIRRILYFLPDDVNVILPVLRLDTSDLLVYRDNDVKLYGDMT